MIDEEILIELYLRQVKSLRQVAAELGCSAGKVRYWLKKYGISSRTKSQSLSGDKNPMYGKTHTEEAKNKISEFQILYSKSDLENIIKGFKVIEYKKQESPIIIECKKCGHRKSLKQAKTAINCEQVCEGCFNARYPNRKYGGANPKYTIQYVKKVCKDNDVNFLESDYYRTTDKYKFQCINGHIWTDTFSEIKRKFRRGTNGCRFCLYDSLRTDAGDIKAILDSKNITLLGDYVNSRSKHKFRCSGCGLKWFASPYSIIHLDSGCPKCNLYKNEKLTGQYIVDILPDANPMPKTLYIPIYKDNSLIRSRTYIDYAFRLSGKNVFVEYNGIQHYEPVGYWRGKSDFDEQVIRDEWLRQYCLDNKIILIEIDGREYKAIKIKRYLIKQFKSVGLI